MNLSVHKLYTEGVGLGFQVHWPKRVYDSDLIEREGLPDRPSKRTTKWFWCISIEFLIFRILITP